MYYFLIFSSRLIAHLKFDLKADDMDECSTKGTACAGPLLLTSKSREICETSMGTLPNDADSDRNIEDVSFNIFQVCIGLRKCSY